MGVALSDRYSVTSSARVMYGSLEGSVFVPYAME